MAVDMSRYLALFVGESTEHLDALARELVRLEEEGADRTAALDAAFRHAHSVKGMAASMGFEATARLSHRLEDIIDAGRSDLKLLDKPTIDVLLAAGDALLAQVKAIEAGQKVGDAEALLSQLGERFTLLTGRAPEATRVANAVVQLQQLQEREASGLAPPLPSPGPPPPQTELPERYAVRLRVNPASATPGVRAFLAWKRLGALGTVTALRPPLEELKAGRIPQGLVTLELETVQTEAGIARAVDMVADVVLDLCRALRPAVPPAPAPAAEPEAPRAVGQESVRTVRVKAEALDALLDQAGELLLATARVRDAGKGLQGPVERLPSPERVLFTESVDRLQALVKELHAKVMSARMTPLSLVTDRLPRAARDIARRRGREVELVIEGADIELDRSIVDELNDPLLHLLRNAIDHGLEPPEVRLAAGKTTRGTVKLEVRRIRDRVLVSLEDDGRGMDVEKLKAAAIAKGQLTPEAAAALTTREALLLSCLPGVSTAQDVTDISGRGVGMDAVKRAVEHVGGTLELESTPGQGTRFLLSLPLTVAVLSLLLLEVGEERFGVPVSKVAGVVEASPAQLPRSRGVPLLNFGGLLIPVHALGELLQLPERRGFPQQLSPVPFLVVETDEGRVALAVDKLLGQEDVVVKALAQPLDRVAGLSGVTILGNGRPVFILDVPRLLVA
jgi:two-component system chemotaxis sensor kinase CheA